MSRTDPSPATTPALASGGGVDPGDTPPIEASTSQTVEHRDAQPNMGPVNGNRTPMIVTLVALALLVILPVLGYGVAELVGYLHLS